MQREALRVSLLCEEQRLVVEAVAHSAQLRDVRHELGVAEHIAEDLAVRLLPEEHATHVKARPGGIERRAGLGVSESSRVSGLQQRLLRIDG